MSDLYAHLLSFELRLEHNSLIFQVFIANNVSRNQARGGGRNVGEEVVAMEGHQTIEVTLQKEATTQEKFARFVAS